MLQRQQWKTALIDASVGDSGAVRQEVIKDVLKVC